MIKRNQHKALSMLELLLWLAVVAVIMIGLTRFFKTDQYSAEVTQTLAKVSKVNAGFIKYLSSTTPQNYTAWPMNNIINAEYASSIDFKAPWPYSSNNASNNPHNYSIVPYIQWSSKSDVSTMKFYIYIYSPPSAICNQIYNQLLQAGYKLSDSPKCKPNTAISYIKARFDY